VATLVCCPQSSRGEWRFRLFGVFVRVKFWFWITILILGGDKLAVDALTWVAVCFASILLHELGHVFAFRMFGRDAEVVLYGWGGMAIPRGAVSGTLGRFVVALAGPAAGFCVVGLVLAAAKFSGAHIITSFHLGIPILLVMPNWTGDVPAYLRESYHWYTLLNDLLFVNFYWGLVNLLPVLPLDGGHAAQALFEQYDPFRGRRMSLILSAAVAGVVVVLGIVTYNFYLVLMFAILAVSSLQWLDGARQREAYRSAR